MIVKPLELAKNRYATKKFDDSKSIPQQKVDELKEILRLAPSSINIQPWQFTFVQNEEVKRRLADVSWFNTDKINQSDLLVIFSVVEDLDAFQKVVDKELPAELRDWYNNSKETMPEADLKNWMTKQVYIALGVGLSASVALGLDATPMEGFEPDKYMDILNMTEYRPVLAMAVGYGSADDDNRPEVRPKSRRPFGDVIISI